MAQDIARETVRQGRLADALGPGDQPGMGQAAGLKRRSQALLGLQMPDQVRIGARVQVRGIVVTHRPAAFRSAPRRCDTAAQISRCTSSTVPVASTTAQRPGSASAIARKVSRMRV